MPQCRLLVEYVPEYNLKVQMEQAHKHVTCLASKGEVIESTKEMSTQALCSYGYVAYKLGYEDDWKDHLELYNDLKHASSKPMDYRSCTKVWNKFIDILKQIIRLSESHCDMLLTQIVTL